MNLKPLINQLAQVLPQLSDKFTDTISVTSLTSSGTTATAITATDHGFTTGDYINISGAIELIDIDSLTFDDGTVSGVTTENNNLSLALNFNTKKTTDVTVTVDNATETDYNGTFTLVSVPDRNIFTYEITTSPTTPATGSPVLYNHTFNRYVGLKQITVVDTTTFTYDIDSAASTNTAGTILAHSSPRVTGAITDDRCLDSYTKEGNDQYWLFVVPDTSFTSKDRDILNDATKTYNGKNTEYRLRLIENVGMLIFIPTSDEISGLGAYNDLEDIKVEIFKAFLRLKSTDPYDAASDFVYTYESGDMLSYNAAYMVYKMVFQVNFDVTYYDTYNNGENAPLLNIDLSININDQNLTANINLDEDV